MDVFDAIILGVVQGVTEFLPISSSAHLPLIQQWLKLDVVHTHATTAALHFATAFAIMVYFWSDIIVMVRAMLRKLGRLPVNEKDVVLLYAVVLGVIPAVVSSVAIAPVLSAHTASVGLIAALLGLSSVLLMYVEWSYYLKPTHETITPRKGLLIGLFQVFALVPGFSRLGATMAGGMLLGLSRQDAAKFSFFLAMSVALGIGAMRLLSVIKVGGSVAWSLVFLSGGLSFLLALLIIHLFLSLMRRNTLWPFIWCNVILAALTGYVAFII